MKRLTKTRELIWRHQRAWKRRFYRGPLSVPFSPAPADDERVAFDVNASLADNHWLEARFGLRSDDRHFYRPVVTVDGISFELTDAHPSAPIISDSMWEEMDGVGDRLIDCITTTGHLTFQQLCQEMTRIEIGRTRAALLTAAARIQPAQTFQTGADPVDMTCACRQCGCTEIRACVDERGPCWWAEADLCSHCADPHPNPCPPGDLKPDGYQVNEAD